jgi:hypothetical protein
VFVASSILHNINLVHDELDVAWKDQLNWETPDDEDDTDIREARERLRSRGRLMHPDAVMAIEDNEERNIVVEALDNYEDATYVQFKKQLIDNNLVEWI